MKRSELEVGEAYYYDRSSTWQESAYANGSKAVVVNLERYEIVKSTWGFHREERYGPDPKGTAVLVDIHSLDYQGKPQVERTAVPVAHLRGPYEATKAAVEKRIADREAHEEAFKEDRRSRLDAADRVVARAVALGLKVERQGSDYDSAQIRVTMRAEVLDALLDAYGQFHAPSGGPTP